MTKAEKWKWKTRVRKNIKTLKNYRVVQKITTDSEEDMEHVSDNSTKGDNTETETESEAEVEITVNGKTKRKKKGRKKNKAKKNK